MTYKRLLCFLILVLANTFFLLEGVYGADKRWASLYIYVVSDENPNACGMNERLRVGDLGIRIDNSNIVTGYRDLSPAIGTESLRRKVAFYPEFGGMFCEGTGDGWRRLELFEPWWEQQLTDTTTSYCGVIRTVKPSPLYDLPPVSPADIPKLRGVITTDWPAQLKLTIRGSRVKIEPLEACFSDKGECVEQVLWHRPSLCPRGTKPGGKGSFCKDAVQKEEDIPENSTNKDPENTTGCCLPGGKCRNLTPENCGMMCGVPLERRCSGNDFSDCANHTGACMVEEKCEPRPETECSCETWMPGKYLGDGSKCPVPEPQKGACCANGKCEITIKAKCEGTFKADFNTCKWDPCNLKTGCCLPGGKCKNMLPSSCESLDGEPLDRACSKDDKRDCEKKTGACCVNGDCSIVFEEACKGVFIEGMEKCEPNPCPPVEGKRVCCIAGECDLLTKKECLEIDSAVFMPQEKTCDPNLCLQVKGGCCYPDGNCEDEVALGDCLIEGKNNRFLSNGCSEECRSLLGACYIPCPNSLGKPCKMLMRSECKSFMDGRFEPDEKCPDISCPHLECSKCSEVFGTWKLVDGDVKFELKSDCTSVIEEPSITNNAMFSKWECDSSDRIVNIWKDQQVKPFTIEGEGKAMKLCYQDGQERICFERDWAEQEDFQTYEKAVFLVLVEASGYSLTKRCAWKISGSEERFLYVERGDNIKQKLEEMMTRILEEESCDCTDWEVFKLGQSIKLISPEDPHMPDYIQYGPKLTIIDGPFVSGKEWGGRRLKVNWQVIDKDGPKGHELYEMCIKAK